MSFQGKRISHEYTQNNRGSAEEVFRLLCPVREADWVPGWNCRLIYSSSGVAELGCVFVTSGDDGSETTWIVTAYDPVSFRIEFAWVNPGVVAAQIQIRLERKSIEETLARIQYIYTGLSERGNEEVDRYDEQWFGEKMQVWEKAINHYLATGSRI
jgi:hypothetical protein